MIWEEVSNLGAAAGHDVQPQYRSYRGEPDVRWATLIGFVGLLGRGFTARFGAIPLC